MNGSHEVLSRPRRSSRQASTTSDSSEAEDYSFPFSATNTEEQTEEAIEDTDEVVSDVPDEVAEESSNESSDEVSGEHSRVEGHPSRVRPKLDWYHFFHY